MAKPKGIRVGQAINFGRCRQGRFSPKEERRALKLEEELTTTPAAAARGQAQAGAASSPDDLYPIKPIRWRVLAVKPDEGIALLIAQKCLASRPFHSQPPYPTWEKSDMRSWLNGEFIEAVFTPQERQLLVITEVPNDASQDCRQGRDGGPTTQDRVFLFSYTEARDYFKDYEDRRCSLTLVAKAQGGYADDEGDCCWWLRSPGSSQDTVGFVSYGGSYSYDKVVNFRGISIRPALWVRYASLL